ncbi:MAG: PspC domain-containing protein [Lachnospiraceae bacterium]|nr:PspC domain-containing protein [Lachnospiraceae bacterium]
MDDKKRVYRSASNRMITGVCGGIAAYFNVDATIVRLGWALVTVFSAGAGIIAYIAASVIIPDETRV